MAASSKTPSSYLQEFCVKRGTVPTYTVVDSSKSPNEPWFLIEVACCDKTASGSGRSKKEAKQAAAKNMLSIMSAVNGGEECAAQGPQPIPSPYEGQLTENAVGSLAELCNENGLSGVSYETVRDEGPPHAKMFTIRCLLPPFGVEAADRTKKQAKQMVAMLMISLLKKKLAGLMPDKYNGCKLDDADRRALGEMATHIGYVDPDPPLLAERVSIGDLAYPVRKEYMLFRERTDRDVRFKNLFTAASDSFTLVNGFINLTGVRCEMLPLRCTDHDYMVMMRIWVRIPLCVWARGETIDAAMTNATDKMANVLQTLCCVRQSTTSCDKSDSLQSLLGDEPAYESYDVE